MALGYGEPRSGRQRPGQSGPIGNLGFLTCEEPLEARAANLLLERGGGIAASCSCLVVDLTKVEFIDSDGVRAVLKLTAQLEAAHKRLILVAPPGSRVLRTLRLLRLNERLSISPSLTAACVRWRQSSSPGPHFSH
jgi:anti-anti-sigma factor